jgi:putative DNA primase/helicase
MEETVETNGERLEAALKLRSAGLNSIPVGSGKKPLIKWELYQSRYVTEARVRLWFGKEFPGANIGIVTGQTSGIDVVDTDTPEAEAAFIKLVRGTVDVEKIPRVRTPRGGAHFYFQHEPGMTNRAGFLINTDLRGQGGFVVCPPSSTEKGAYVWEIGLEEGFPPLPPVLVKLLSTNGKGYIRPEGLPLTQGHRDNDLFHLALSLLKDNVAPEEVLSTVLRAAAASAPPFPEAQAKAKFRSALARYQRRQSEAGTNAQAPIVETTGPVFISRKANTIRTRPVGWLWLGVVPFGMPTALEGDPGVGKTFVADDIVARVTRGLAFPGYLQNRDREPVRGSVVYITSEGVPDRILVPRLVAAGADLERVEIVEGITNNQGGFEILDVNQHLPALARRMRNETDIKLVVIDPLASHLSPKVNMNSSLEMRAAMDCIARFAEETGCAVLVVMHLNKDDRKAAIHRAAGSGQIMAGVKSCWAVVKKPGDENDNRRYFGPVKSNLAPYRRSLAFDIQSVPVHFDDGTTGDIGRIVWSLEPEEFDLQAALSPGAFELHSKMGQAVTLLRAQLADGSRLVRDIFREAEAAGISKDTLWKAKRKEGIEDGREVFGGPSKWYYAEKERPA